MKFHITVEVTTRVVYEVDAKDSAHARRVFSEDGGKRISEEEDLPQIAEVEPAEANS